MLNLLNSLRNVQFSKVEHSYAGVPNFLINSHKIVHMLPRDLKPALEKWQSEAAELSYHLIQLTLISLKSN